MDNEFCKEMEKLLPKRKDDSHKGSFGKLLLIAGGKNMAGAAFFAAKAAYRSGVGLVYIYTPECNRIILQQLIPEAVLYTYDKPDINELTELVKDKDAIAMGPGIGVASENVPILEYVLSLDCKVVLDADGLNLLSKNIKLLKHKKCTLTITPHMAEMSRLLSVSVSDICKEKDSIALSFAREYGLITVLKDHRTIISDGEMLYHNVTGNHGMATAGSGDVLTGVIGSLLAQGMNSFEAARLGVYMHGKAGDDAAAVRGKRSLMASDIADYLFWGL